MAKISRKQFFQGIVMGIVGAAMPITEVEAEVEEKVEMEAWDDPYSWSPYWITRVEYRNEYGEWVAAVRRSKDGK